MTRRHLKIALGLIVLIIVLLTVALNLLNLREAYGDGPPYYGRTTNMDKWESPLPMLLPVDAVVIVLLGVYAIWLRRTRSRNPR
ncbi:hypothetical protein WJ59_00600 [Burkholderia gladioli]|uniref:hypothetical protein n=1 Tax=Burkholderia gladioli TaxID=28095 RepID=UPI0007557870|nr:hypothetical protein [Burkholderia gladioli]KVM70312.1 hypothetical protein WJ59_00600 [Burkholderia gladioli]